MLLLVAFGIGLLSWTQLAEKPLGGRADTAASTDAQASIRTAGQLRQAGKLGEALNVLEELPVTSVPAQLQNRRRLEIAQCYFELGKIHSATKLLSEIQRDQLNTSEANVADFLQAELALRSRDLAQAESALSQLEKKMTSGPLPTWAPTVQLRRTELLLAKQEPEKAFNVAQDSWRQFPDFQKRYEFVYVMARAEIAAARFTQARLHLKSVIDDPHAVTNSAAARAQWLLGETYFLQENLPAAIIEYEKVAHLGQYPTWISMAELQRAKCLEKLDRLQLAKQEYEAIVRKYPNTEAGIEASQRLYILGNLASRAPSNSSDAVGFKIGHD